MTSEAIHGHRIHVISLAVLALLAIFGGLVACEKSSPTEPTDQLQARFTGTFSPATIDELGNVTRECVIELTAQPSGGRPDYRFAWQIAWIRQAVLVEGYPSQAGVVLVLPPDFGGGLFPIRLQVTDREDDMSSASTERRFDCAAGEAFTFTGL